MSDCLDLGLPVFGCCPPECQFLTATVSTSVSIRGFTLPFAPSVGANNCAKYRTRQATLRHSDTLATIWQVLETWNFPRNTVTTTLVVDDGTLTPGWNGTDINGHVPQSLTVDGGTSFTWLLGNGVTTPYFLDLDFSDIITLTDVVQSLDSIVPDDATLNTLSYGTNWQRGFASDGSVFMTEVTTGWNVLDRYFIDCLNAYDEFGDPLVSPLDPLFWKPIAERSQKIEGVFPPTNPTLIVAQTGGNCTIRARDMRSRLNIAVGLACFARDTIVQDPDNSAPCVLLPTCEGALVYAGAAAPSEVIIATPVANETVAIRCGECP